MDKKKLNSSAKAFVPHSMLSSSAAPWTPTPAANSGSSDKNKEPSKDDKAPQQSSEATASPPETASTAKKTANESKPTEKTTAAPTKPEAPPPVPVVNVWVKKPSNAILTAPTPEQQQQRAQQQRNQNRSNRGGAGQQNQQQRQGRHGNNANNKDDNKQSQWRNNQKNDNWRGQRGGGRDGGRGGGRERGRGRHNENSEEAGGRGGQGGNNNSGGGSTDNWSRGKSLPLELLKPNEGKDEMEKAVARVGAAELLSLRLSFVAPPLAWEQAGGDGGNKVVGPPDECRWESPTRLQEIDAITNAKRLGGDVSFKRKKRQEAETAPPLEDCKPLEVNDETRWKAGVFKKDGSDEENLDSNDAILKKSLLILNKLSLTKFEKLSNEFIATGIGRNEECLAGAIELIVKKAQDEQHFSAMYAALCLKLSKTPMEFEPPGKNKKFKKMLLTECQKEFEQDTNTKIAIATEGIDDEEERQNKTNLVKKHYVGHMRFIGELYKGDLISIKIMLMCLSALLESELSPSDQGDDSSTSIDEEKVECFAKLMTVIGMILEQQSLSMKSSGKADPHQKLSNCWKSVEIMAGKRKEDGPKVSNRIKFMLQDLIEMRDKGWVQRREEESAKTIAQIHKEAAKEARRGSSSGGMNRSMSSNNIRRQSSSNDVLSIARSSSKPNVDAEGFTEINRSSGFGRSQSLGNFARTDSKTNLKKADKSKVSSGGSFAAFNNVSSAPKKENQKTKSKEVLPNVDEKKPIVAKTMYKSPEECGKKMKNYLKEYFVGGDTDDVVLSIHELIGAGSEGSIDRGAKMVENGVLMVLEMKADNVDKFISVITRCFTEKKIEAQAIVTGLNEPLELLNDIAIDAPLATSHMVSIISKLIEVGSIKFDFLLDSPEYFRSDCGAAQLGCKVLKKLGGDAVESKANVDVIEKLMTDSDKELYPKGAKDMLS